MSSNRQPEDNENLLSHIASTVKVILDRMVTKEDLEPFATKDDLKHFATKEYLERFATKEDFERLVTKEEFEPVRQQVKHLTEQFAFLGGQVEDIRDRMATKGDIVRLDSRLDGLDIKVDKLEVTTTVIKGEVEQVHLRLDGIDRTLTSEARSR